jgi:glycogen synthase
MNNLNNINSINQQIINKILNQVRYNQDSKELNDIPRRVLLFSSEYLPKDTGEIALQCKTLAEGLVDKGIDTHVITFDPWKAGINMEMGGVNVHYIGNNIKSYSPLTWALTLNMEAGIVVSKILHEQGKVDLIHSHQWEMFPSGITLQSALNTPFVVNYYSTEHQRNPFVSNSYVDSVKQIEWRGSQRSDRIIVGEEWLKNEIIKYYSPEPKKVNVVDPTKQRWTKNVVRDYNWVLKNFGKENNEIIFNNKN